MKVSGETAVYALLGHPVRHSRSPEIYNPLFEKHGVDAVYVALDVATDRGADLGDMIRALGLAGVNLTVPFKADIIPALDEMDGVAAALGAVNVVANRDGRLVGYNTDATGFCRALEADVGPVIKGARVVVLGAGGAGRAVGLGLAAAGARQVTWLNRTLTHAEGAVERGRVMSSVVEFEAIELGQDTLSKSLADADIVVQCLAGRGIDVIRELSVGALRSGAVWCDINYWMSQPPHCEALRARGHHVHTGLPMLAYQAAEAFQLFTGLVTDPVQILSRLR